MTMPGVLLLKEEKTELSKKFSTESELPISCVSSLELGTEKP